MRRGHKGWTRRVASRGTMRPGRPGRPGPAASCKFGRSGCAELARQGGDSPVPSAADTLWRRQSSRAVRRGYAAARPTSARRLSLSPPGVAGRRAAVKDGLSLQYNVFLKIDFALCLIRSRLPANKRCGSSHSASVAFRARGWFSPVAAFPFQFLVLSFPFLLEVFSCFLFLSRMWG